MKNKFIVIEESELEGMFNVWLEEVKRHLSEQQAKSDKWIESKNVPNYLSISRKTWQTYRDKELIPFSQVGRKIWVKQSDLDTFLESCSIGKHSKTTKY